MTEEIGRLELKDGLGNLTLGYFTAIGRQTAFKKLAGAEDFVAKLVTESNLRAAGMGNPKRWISGWVVWIDASCSNNA